MDSCRFHEIRTSFVVVVVEEEKENSAPFSPRFILGVRSSTTKLRSQNYYGSVRKVWIVEEDSHGNAETLLTTYRYRSFLRI